MTLERKTGLKRGAPLKASKKVIYLRRDDPDPEGEPKRYLDKDGYLRLRWKLGPGQYAQRFERNPDETILRTVPSKVNRVDHAAVARLYQEGSTTTEVAAILGCDAGLVSRSLKRSGIGAQRKVDYAPEIDVEEVVRRYEDLEGYVPIAREMGISTKRIRDVLEAAGIAIRSVGAAKGKKTGPKKGPVSYETEFERMKPLVRARSEGICEASWSPKCTGRGTHVHHRKLRSQGGKNDMATLLDVCLHCHMTIHGNPRQARELGFLIRRNDDPAEVPVARMRKIV